MQKYSHIYFCKNKVKNHILVLSTVPDEKTGQKIASELLEKRLAACVTISAPVCSIYRWKNKIAQDKEFMLFIKTGSENYTDLEKKIIELHPYDVPEVVAIPLMKGYSKYLEWIDQETK